MRISDKHLFVMFLFLSIRQFERYLENAFGEKFIWLVYLNVDPVFDELRHEFAFKRLLNRIGFPRKAQARRI